jgi:hypothetical protein
MHACINDMNDSCVFSECRHAFNQAEPRTHTQVETERAKAYPDPSRDPGDGVVKVPKIYWEFTTKGILTMEWIDGIKLTDRDALLAAKLDIQQLVDQVLLLFTMAFVYRKSLSSTSVTFQHFASLYLRVTFMWWFGSCRECYHH